MDSTDSNQPVPTIPVTTPAASEAPDAVQSAPAGTVAADTVSELAGGPADNDPPAVAWWAIRNPWQDNVQIDEFGGGTNDGCGPYAIENAAANYEHRLPTYQNGEDIRGDMIAHGNFTPHDGCFLHDIAAEIPRRRYTVPAWLDAQASTLASELLDDALDAHKCAAIIEVYNAQALPANEPGVTRHFVTIAAWGGAEDGAAPRKYYLLNSDYVRTLRHSPQTGQWVTYDQLRAADIRGFVLMAPQPPAPTPPPPAPSPSPWPKQYRVQPGDSLFVIAEREYGATQGGKWPAIYAANIHLIGPDPNIIRVGMELEIPAP